MAKIIETYLTEIQKALEVQSLPEDYIIEFLDNYRDQLEIMVDEIFAQEPEKSRTELEATVISRCEAVDTVVQRVVEELELERPRVSLTQPTQIKSLIPVEKALLRSVYYFDITITRIGQWLRRTLSWYKRNESPSLTAIYYTLVIVFVNVLVFVAANSLPTIYQITTFSDNRTFLSLSEHVSSPTGYSSTPISFVIWISLIALLTFSLILHIGWKFDQGYAIKTGFILALILGTILTIFGTSGRRFLISYRDAANEWQLFSQDWYRGFSPSMDDYTTHFVNLIVLNVLLLTLVTCLSFIILGSLVKGLKKRTYRAFSLRSAGLTGLKAGLLIVCIFILLIVPPSYEEFPRNKDIPLPTTEISIIYKFDIDWSVKYSSRNISLNYATTLPQFGRIAFFFYEFYNLTFNGMSDQTPPDISTTGQLNPLLEGEDLEASSSSKAPFPLLGLLYLPNRTNSRSWEEFIGNEINNSYPFSGFSPAIDTTRTSIEWLSKGQDIQLMVNTITYSSTTNQSVYIFSFDSITGWLMSAELTNEATSWVPGGLDLRTMTITRSFVLGTIKNPNEYYTWDLVLISALVLITVTSIVIPFSLGNRSKKKNKLC